MKLFKLILFFCLLHIGAMAQPMKLGLLVYNGGGDWYANPTSLKNLAAFCNQQLHTNLQAQEGQVEVGSPDIFNYPFLHMTGHGRWDLSEAEAQNLRKYLEAGGFLHIDDNYGLDPYVRPALKKVFPELTLVELPFTHPIYHQKYNFPNGLPKIHEHDNKPPKGFGLIYKGRLVCFYTWECDLGDGWEDFDVHRDPPEKHLAALQMGANIIQYVFSNSYQ
ncbi:DUF4159 domain-containing protein [Taibaiella soli]|uniref:DUF4159 domain-containing protein n=1 Tax=Taibaiella soli TaxID=1649169 RepID=A0A2W2AWK4_9BACT|nr:DUF4159 domain-containing protein [Taibaiella soli]PZF72354.1 hypothetical protein DN068_13450 [Taibaiella soli]